MFVMPDYCQIEIKITKVNCETGVAWGQTRPIPLKFHPVPSKSQKCTMFQHLVFCTLVKVKVYLEVDQHI